MSSEDKVVWSDLAGTELDAPTLYDVLALRSAVFVVEQECAYQDPDGRDLLEGTRHLIGRQGVVAAYARMLAPDTDLPVPRIGRVIVTRPARGQHLGRRLIERALSSCEEHWSGKPIELGGQAHLVDFYRSFGFVPIGAPYVEDGIPHQWMRREPE
jgi:ElaA protein